ncbi:hypothetical protein MRX96_037697 [Rhipicephalus microplus]
MFVGESVRRFPSVGEGLLKTRRPSLQCGRRGVPPRAKPMAQECVARGRVYLFPPFVPLLLEQDRDWPALPNLKKLTRDLCSVRRSSRGHAGPSRPGRCSVAEPKCTRTLNEAHCRHSRWVAATSRETRPRSNTSRLDKREPCRPAELRFACASVEPNRRRLLARAVTNGRPSPGGQSCSDRPSGALNRQETPAVPGKDEARVEKNSTPMLPSKKASLEPKGARCQINKKRKAGHKAARSFTFCKLSVTVRNPKPAFVYFGANNAARTLSCGARDVTMGVGASPPAPTPTHVYIL